jgi:ketosteroid isomerase-like protein
MGDPGELVDRLLRATNEHDVDGIEGCFAEDYENVTPSHPSRSFRGRAQVRRNWEQIFAFIPDLQAQVSRRAIDGETAWTEWVMTGTRRDGTPHEMRGVIVFGVGDRVAKWARFFLEPVDENAGSVDDAVRDQVARR